MLNPLFIKWTVINGIPKGLGIYDEFSVVRATTNWPANIIKQKITDLFPYFLLGLTKIVG